MPQKTARIPLLFYHTCFGLLSVLVLAGCKEAEITEYKVPKDNRPPQRLLGAIAPHGERIWFFKLLGPQKEVGAHREQFQQFIESLRFSDKAERPVTWKAPEGWREKPSKEALRHTTFELGPKDAPLELIVTPLGMDAGNLAANINRWRGQMGLPEVPRGELAGHTREIKVDGKTITLVDIQTEASGKPTFTAPKDWIVIKKNVQFSIATFETREDGKKAEITVSSLRGPGGGLLSNVNRWRAQLGLKSLEEETLGKETGELEVDGVKATSVDITGATPSDEKRRFLGVIVPRANETWFFKMSGPPELVEKQKANFEAFVKSVRFDGDRGGKP